MEIMVTCSDHRRRVAQVEQKPFSGGFVATVKNADTGQTVSGFAFPSTGLEYTFKQNRLLF